MLTIKRVPSILLDQNDRSLKRFDSEFRRALSRGFPTKWTPPTDTPGEPRDAGAVAHIYLGLFEAGQNQPEKAIRHLRDAFEAAEAPQIKARALQTLVHMLLVYSIYERGVGHLDLSVDYETECKTLCERGLVEFSDHGWSNSIKYVLHAALGVFDHFAGNELSAILQLKRSSEEYKTLSNDFDRNVTEPIGLAHLCLGELAMKDHNLDAAIQYYSGAVRELNGTRKAEAAARLSSAILDVGNDPRHAMRVAKRALRDVHDLIGKHEAADLLRCCLARATLALGDRATGERIYREVVATGVDEDIKKEIRRWLERSANGR